MSSNLSETDLVKDVSLESAIKPISTVLDEPLDPELEE